MRNLGKILLFASVGLALEPGVVFSDEGKIDLLNNPSPYMKSSQIQRSNLDSDFQVRKRARSSNKDLKAAPYDDSSDFYFRTSFAVGARYLGNEMMEGDQWSNVLGLSFAPLHSYACKSSTCRFGLDVGVNSGWASRFNSVNSTTNNSLIPVGIYNSPQFDFLLFWGVRGQVAGFELGAGASVSWIKWRNTTQLATSGSRAAPKLRAAFTLALNKSIDWFLAGSYAFNVYGDIKCAGTPVNCFNDGGYTGVADLTTGVNYYIG